MYNKVKPSLAWTVGRGEEATIQLSLSSDSGPGEPLQDLLVLYIKIVWESLSQIFKM